MRRIARWSVISSLAVAASVSLGLVPSSGGVVCTMSGDDGPNEIHGTPGNDVICGFKGDDRLHGGGGNDTILAGAGDDFASGERGDDSVSGGVGRDAVIGRGGNDTLDGGDGVDSADGGLGRDEITGSDGRDIQLYGGQSGADVVRGGRGDDHCVATIDAQGNDRLFGGPGTDGYWSDPGDEVNGAENFGPCFAE